jgi:hypothetical protein
LAAKVAANEIQDPVQGGQIAVSSSGSSQRNMAPTVIAGPHLETKSHTVAGEAKEKPILLEGEEETLNASGVAPELHASRVATVESDAVTTSPFAPLDRTGSQRERNFDTMAVSLTQVLGDHHEAKQSIHSVTAQYVANPVASAELLRTQVTHNSALTEEDACDRSADWRST